MKQCFPIIVWVFIVTPDIIKLPSPMFTFPFNTQSFDTMLSHLNDLSVEKLYLQFFSVKIKTNTYDTT